MSILKTMGRVVYFRARRIAKAFKNWKRFGVIIFGSLMLLANTLPMALASGFLTVGVSPSGSTITAGTSATFSATVKLDGGLTSFDTLTWSVNGTVNQAAANNPSFTLTPATAGTYNIVATATKAGSLPASGQAVLTVQASGNGGGGGGDNGGTTQLLTVGVTPSGSTVNPGESKTFAATVKLNGVLTAFSSLKWYFDGIENTSYRNNAAFTVSSMVAGDHAIRVEASKVVSGQTLTATANATLMVRTTTPPAETMVITITPPEPKSTQVGTPLFVPYAAQVTKNGQPFNPDMIRWYVNDTFRQTGGAFAFSAPMIVGTYAVRAEAVHAGLPTAYSNIAYVYVTPAPAQPIFATFEINPPTATLYLTAGANIQNLIYTARDSQGNVIHPNIAWSLNPTIGTLSPIDNGRQFTATQLGSTVVTAVATWGNITLTDFSTITVLPAPVVGPVLNSVRIEPPFVSLTAGQSQSFTAQAYDLFNNTINTGVNYQWQLLNPSIGTLNQQFGQTVLFTANAGINNTFAGVLRVTAFFDNQTPRMAEATIQINDVIVAQEMLDRVQITVSRNPILTNDSTVLTAQAYSNLGHIWPATYNWQVTSGNASLSATTGQQVTLYSNILTGPVTVQVWATNGNTVTNTATVIVQGTVVPPTPNYFIASTFTAIIEDGSTPSEGDIILYTIVLQNNQPNTVTGVRLTMDVPQYTTFISATSPVDHPRISGRTITWDAGTLNQGQSQVLRVRAMINSGLPQGGVSITGRAYVRADQIPQGFHIVSNTIYVNAGTGVVGTTPAPDGKGPLAPTGLDWQTLMLMMMGALVLTIGTFWAMERRSATSHF